MNTTHTSDQTFEADVINSEKPVLVDFWADYCPPCRRLAPILDEIASEQDSYVICKLDVMANPKTMAAYEIKGLPTMLLFFKGKVVGRKVGALSKAQILDFLNQANYEAS